MSRTRVLMMDGQDKVRRGLCMRLAIEPDIEVVGETGEAEEVVSLAQVLDPDVIVVDIAQRGAQGYEFLRRLRTMAPRAYIAVLTLHVDAEARQRAYAAGAQAFLEKSDGVQELLEFIRYQAGPAFPGFSKISNHAVAARQPTVEPNRTLYVY